MSSPSPWFWTATGHRNSDGASVVTRVVFSKASAWLGAIAGLCLTVGCQTDPRTKAKPAPTPTPIRLEPLDASVGRVASVNLPLQFVVLDYTLSRVPQPGDRLELSRDGAVVGELKLGYYSRDNTVVADIISGTPAIGDAARPLRP